MTLRRPTLAALSLILLVPGWALAHHEPSDGGFWSGVLHPLTGLDHLLVIAAIVAWTAYRDRVSVAVPALVVGLFASGHHWAFGGETSGWSVGVTLMTVALLGVGLGVARMSHGQATRWA